MTATPPPVSAAAPPKSKRKPVVIGGILLVLAGVGGGAYAASSGLIGGAHEEDRSPKLVRKGDVDDFAPPAEEAEGHEPEDGAGGSPYRLSYFTFADEFTSNLRGSDHFVQLGLAAATPYDGRVIGWMARHELALRSEILLVLADTPEEDASSPEGKRRLAKRLVAAINGVLTAREGFGGVQSVQYRTFIVQ